MCNRVFYLFDEKALNGKIGIGKEEDPNQSAKPKKSTIPIDLVRSPESEFEAQAADWKLKHGPFKIQIKSYYGLKSNQR